MRLLAVSVDLDEIPHYHAIHGLPAPASVGATAVYDLALSRFDAWARELDLPLTLFAIGADMARAENATALRAMASRGHEIGNHTLDHRYDLVRLSRAEMTRQVVSGADVLAGATGQRPTGFRAPGYTVTDELLDVVRECGAEYDASVFPSPAYWGVKLAAMGAIAARGRGSRSIVGSPRVLLAPASPYRMGLPYWRRGDGLREIPVQVTRGTRLPFIGTPLALAPDALRAALVRGVSGETYVNLELHGIDALDARDGLEPLREHQLEVRVPFEEKLRRIGAAIRALRDDGFQPARMDELARRALP